MPTDEELEKYKKPDGTIDWGRLAMDRIAKLQKKPDLSNGTDGTDGANGANGTNGTDGTDGTDVALWFIFWFILVYYGIIIIRYFDILICQHLEVDILRFRYADISIY